MNTFSPQPYRGRIMGPMLLSSIGAIYQNLAITESWRAAVVFYRRVFNSNTVDKDSDSL